MTNRTEKISADVSGEAKDKLIQLCSKFERSRGFMLERMINKFHAETFKQPDKEDSESVTQAFELFWSAGMRKLNKKKCFSLFKSVCKKYKNDDPMDIAQSMADDIQHRISINQLGFEQMHPTTYINGERWLDERVQDTNAIGYKQGANSDPMAGVNAALEQREQRNNQGSGQAHLVMESGGRALPHQMG